MGSDDARQQPQPEQADDADCRSAAAASALRLATLRLAHDQPFHARLLSSWVVEQSSETQTMAVTMRRGEVHLLYSPAFVAGISLDELGAVLTHEVGHVVLGHLFLDTSELTDELALLVAEETAANEWVGGLLPGKPILLEDFPWLPPDEETPVRYQRLKRRGSSAAPGQIVDDHTGWPGAGASPPERRAAAVQVAAALDSLSDEEAGRMPAAMLARVRRRLGRAPGLHSGGNTTALDPALAVLDWRLALRELVTLVEPVPSLRRPSRRLPQLVGIAPGRSRAAVRPQLAAIVDTSGSMGKELLDEISAELLALRAFAEVTVVQCDAQVHRVQRLIGPLTAVVGGGGTDLGPALDHAAVRDPRVHAIAIFTDGELGERAPLVRPAAPVLWVLPARVPRPAPWGQVARLGSRC